MNYNSHTQTSLKNKSNSLHTSFNFACIKICLGSSYAPSWQARTRKRGLQAVCVSVFSKIHKQEGKKKFYIYVYHAKAAAEIPKWPLHMLFQMTETISVAVLLNNSVVCNKNIPCPSVCLQY